jgi:hypothetical protein
MNKISIFQVFFIFMFFSLSLSEKNTESGLNEAVIGNIIRELNSDKQSSMRIKRNLEEETEVTNDQMDSNSNLDSDEKTTTKKIEENKKKEGSIEDMRSTTKTNILRETWKSKAAAKLKTTKRNQLKNSIKSLFTKFSGLSLSV